jgi:hypothetical protein
MTPDAIPIRDVSKSAEMLPATRLHAPGHPAPKESTGDAGRHAMRRRFYRLWVVLVAGTLVQLVPVFRYGDATAPYWMRGIVLAAFLQGACWLWMALVPDWSSLWIAMVLSAGAAAGYAFALAIAVVAPEGQIDILQMNPLRDGAQIWTMAMLVLSGGLTLACGVLSFSWRKFLGPTG